MNRRARSINHRMGTLRFAHPTLANRGRVIRIISARTAIRKEKRIYEEG